jgi:hypothetical protein
MVKMFHIVAASAFVALSFPAAVYVMDHLEPRHAANETRARDVKRLKEAIERYYRDRGTYPALPGNPVDDLHKDLVEGGYLKEIPSDPLRAEGLFQYQYASDGRTKYAILIRQQAEQNFARSRTARLCVVGVDPTGLGGWGSLPKCWF